MLAVALKDQERQKIRNFDASKTYLHDSDVIVEVAKTISKLKGYMNFNHGWNKGYP